MACDIRPASETDADAISDVIISALRQTNSSDYPAHIIDRVAENFCPAAVRELLGRRIVFVAVDGGRIVGTASLDGAVVRTVFVAPTAQGRGIGAGLMAAVERAAAAGGIAALTVPSSIRRGASMKSSASTSSETDSTATNERSSCGVR